MKKFSKFFRVYFSKNIIFWNLSFTTNSSFTNSNFKKKMVDLYIFPNNKLLFFLLNSGSRPFLPWIVTRISSLSRTCIGFYCARVSFFLVFTLELACLTRHTYLVWLKNQKKETYKTKSIKLLNSTLDKSKSIQLLLTFNNFIVMDFKKKKKNYHYGCQNWFLPNLQCHPILLC